MQLTDLNWQILDESRAFSYREDRLKKAQELGFNFISECTVKLYQQLGSTEKVAKIIGLTGQTVATELKSYGVTLKPPGGAFMKGKKRDKKWARHKWNPLNKRTASNDIPMTRR